MSNFKNDIPSFKSYRDNGGLYFSTIPSSVWSGFSGLIRRSAKDATTLKAILNTFAEIIPTNPTSNWGFGWLENEIPDYVSTIRRNVDEGKINKFFDCLAVLVEVGELTVDNINEFLEDTSLGYEVYEDVVTRKMKWCLREGTSSVVEDITSTQNAVKSVSKQAYEEFARAKESLKDAADERARKDAVRSCVSAMEAVVKEYGKDSDIKVASRNLRSSKNWGNDDIVKQGDSIFNTIHRLYPDLRHGSTQTSTMSIEEAEYWIGRISVYLQYMKKMADKNGIR